MLREVALYPFIRQKPTGFVHPVEGLVQHESQFRREFQLHRLADMVTQFALRAVERHHRFIGILAAKG